MTVAALAEQSSVIVCCGPGGVGKTTAAAALALHAARSGRRAVVVTIDPARRLADALGLGNGGLGNDPTRIAAIAGIETLGTSGPGELWAMMLDTPSTFDALVRRHAATPEQVDRILANRFYRNIAGALSGTQEYMAAEKLYELHADDRFDLVVVDTPPTRNALDFLDAPARLTRFLDHRLYRMLMAPTRVGMRVVNLAAQAVLRTISKVVGGDVIADVIAFFRAFDGMEAGFRERAESVMRLLRAPGTGYVLVTSPRHDAVTETTFFADRLAADGLEVAGLVVNRVHPHFGSGTADDADERAETAKVPADAALWRNLAELRRTRERELDAVTPLIGRVPAGVLAVVPLFDRDVHDLDALAVIADALAAEGSSTGSVPAR